jgi:diadenosine tetraphosphate (Ap4A) HIT family hydrolase
LLPKKIQASIFVSTTQLLETWNQSNQIKSKLEFVVKNSSFNFCFNNNTTRNKSNQTNSNVHWKVIEMEGSSFNFHDFLEVVMPMESSSLK